MISLITKKGFHTIYLFQTKSQGVRCCTSTVYCEYQCFARFILFVFYKTHCKYRHKPDFNSHLHIPFNSSFEKLFEPQGSRHGDERKKKNDKEEAQCHRHKNFYFTEDEIEGLTCKSEKRKHVLFAVFFAEKHSKKSEMVQMRKKHHYYGC